jgi:hypothetical protein
MGSNVQLTFLSNAKQLYTSFRKSVILAGTFKKRVTKFYYSEEEKPQAENMA